MISVIIPNYNRTNEITLLLAMLSKIPMLIGEIIIVDDASIPTLDAFYSDIKRRFDNLRIIIIQRQTNTGPGACRNAGINRSTYDLLLFIDSDVYCDSGCIQKLYEQITQHDITFPTVQYHDGNLKSPLNMQFYKEHCMNSCIFMIKRLALKKMDMGFDEDIRIGEDFDFFLRASIFGLKSGYVHEAIASHPDLRSCSLNADNFRINLQHPIYAYLKLIGMCKYHIPWIAAIGCHVLTHFFGVVSGKHYALFSNEPPVPYSASRWVLAKSFCRAISSNLRKVPEIMRKRNHLKNAIIQSRLSP